MQLVIVENSRKHFSYPMKLMPTERFGLLGEFTIEPEFRDIDDSTSITRWQSGLVGGDFSLNNKNALKPFFKENMKTFVEIGISRDKWADSSTKFLLDNLREDGRYVGIDIEDRKFVESLDPRAKIILGDSQDVETNLEKINLQGNYIDLLLIDGHHSVTYVSKEWDYAKYVRPNGGVIVLHDSNYHPGPWCLTRAVDPNIFDIHKLCPEDYGITVLVRK